MCCRNESARDAARAPAAQDDASYHFLTVGTGGGNSAGCGLKGLYRASFWARFRRHGPNTSLPRNHRAGTAVPSQPTPRLPVGAPRGGLVLGGLPNRPSGRPCRSGRSQLFRADGHAVKHHLEPGSLVDRRGGGYPPLRRLAFGFDIVGGMKVFGIVSREGSVPHVAEGRDVVPLNGYCGQENA